jgi:hypothetical protein
MKTSDTQYKQILSSILKINLQKYNSSAKMWLYLSIILLIGAPVGIIYSMSSLVLVSLFWSGIFFILYVFMKRLHLLYCAIHSHFSELNSNNSEAKIDQPNPSATNTTICICKTHARVR